MLTREGILERVTDTAGSYTRFNTKMAVGTDSAGTLVTQVWPWGVHLHRVILT